MKTSILAGCVLAAALFTTTSCDRATAESEIGVAPRLDTVHPSSRMPSSLRRIHSVTSTADGVLIEVGGGWYPIPSVGMTQGSDGISIEVGDPFLECGGFTGPCNHGPDTSTIQRIFVPFADFPTCTGRITVVGSESSTPITYFRCGFGAKLTITAFVWRSEGGFSGRGTGESITLAWSGSLRRILRDSLGELDTVEGFVAASMLDHADSVLSLVEVRSLPSPSDTLGSVVSDGLVDEYRTEGRSSILMDLHQPTRYCSVAATDRSSGESLVMIQTPVSCLESNGLRELKALVAALRVAPLLQPR